jgi:hypothetical protein
VKPTAFETAALGVATYRAFELKKNDTGEVEQVAHEYILVLDMNALAKVKEETGIDLMDRENWPWGSLNAQEITTALWCAMLRFHPDMTPDAVRAIVPPMEVWKVRNMLLELCYPGALERIAKASENGGSGELAPANPPAATS